jgi:hypothetical protein
MTSPAPDPGRGAQAAGGAGSAAAPSGIARAHRGLALLFLVLGVVAFFLAGLAVFDAGTNFDAHRGVGTLMLLIALILLILAIVGRRAAVQASAVLFGLMVLQSLLAVLGSETSAVIGALHPVNGLLVLFAASLAAAGKPFPVARRA